MLHQHSSPAHERRRKSKGTKLINSFDGNAVERKIHQTVLAFKWSAKNAKTFRNWLMWLQHAVTINCAAALVWCVSKLENWSDRCQLDRRLFFFFFCMNFLLNSFHIERLSIWFDIANIEHSVRRHKHEIAIIPKRIHILLMRIAWAMRNASSTYARDRVPRTQWPSTAVSVPFLFYFIYELKNLALTLSRKLFPMHILHERIFHSVAVMRTVCECAQFHYSLIL